MSTQIQDLIKYSVTDAAIAEMGEKYLSLKVHGLDDGEGYALCKEARKAVRDTRLNVEERRKELKAESLEFGRAVDSEAKRITAMLEPIELHLVSQMALIDNEKKRREDEAKRQAKERLDSRVSQLQAVNATFSIDELVKLDDEAFDQLLTAAETRFNYEQRRIAEERQRLEALERERAAQEERARKDREKIAELEREQQRMRQEAEAKQRAEERATFEAAQAAKAEADKKAAEAAEALRKEREAIERAEAAEKAKREAEELEARKRVADEKLFHEIKTAFPTLDLAWVEIARLTKLVKGDKSSINGGVRRAVRENATI